MVDDGEAIAKKNIKLKRRIKGKKEKRNQTVFETLKKFERGWVTNSKPGGVQILLWVDFRPTYWVE